MAKDKDKSLNPAAAQRKLEKQKAVKKGKAAVQAQRTERLATRNPTRLESQIADLHALRDSHGGKLRPRDQKQLEDLERDVARIKKARETVGGDKAPGRLGRDGKERANKQDRQGKSGEDRPPRDGDGRRAGYTGLGKRRREEHGHRHGGSAGEESETTDEDVRRIPWPRDTPPPIPRQHQSRPPLDNDPSKEDGQDRGEEKPLDTSLPAKPPPSAAARTTYEGKAQVRDLRKEATQAFVPQVVKRKIEAVQGGGGTGKKLLEEDEMEKLEREGYVAGGGTSGDRQQQQQRQGQQVDGQQTTVSERRSGETVQKLPEPRDTEEETRLRREEEAFQREIAAADGDDDMEVDDSSYRVEGSKEAKGLQATVEEASDEDQ